MKGLLLEEDVSSLLTAATLQNRLRRLSLIPISAAKTYVKKSTISRRTESWPTTNLRDASKRRNNLRWTVTENLSDHLAVTDEVECGQTQLPFSQPPHKVPVAKADEEKR